MSNASASISKYTCNTPQWNCKHKHKCQHKEWKNFYFLALAFALAFAFHTWELGQCKGKHKHKMKNTHSMPLQFKFNPRWHPSLPSLISLPESSLPDCWSRASSVDSGNKITTILGSWNAHVYLILLVFAFDMSKLVVLVLAIVSQVWTSVNWAKCSLTSLA